MTRQQVLAESIRDSRFLLVRYLKGFDDSNHTKQAPGLPNHVAWTLGHLAVSLSRITERIDGTPIPESDFAKGGGSDRFDLDAVGFGSKPVDDPALYPSMSRCTAIFDAAVERLAVTVANASDAKLDAPAKWGKVDVPAWSLATRMVFHNGTHCGQIADLRRALGMGTVLG
jgi:hypothetical protein